jgi:outer membrane protein assembly factor BamD
VEECNKLIDELRRKQEFKAFSEGELYYNLRQYQSAVIVFDNVLRDYPESPEAEHIRYLIAKSAFHLAKNSVVDKKTDRLKEAIVRCNDFMEKFATGKYAKEVKLIKREAEQEIKTVKKRLKS